MACLVAKTEAAGQAFRLDLPDTGEAVIGRAADRADLVVPDGSVSGRHCLLSRSADGWTVKDLDSTNGTRVNGEVVTEATLVSGDTLMIGDRRFVLQDQSAGGSGSDADTADGNLEPVELPESPVLKMAPRSTQAPTVKVLPPQFQKRTPHARRWVAIIIVFVVVAVALAVRYVMTLR